MSLVARNIHVRLGRRDILAGADFVAEPGQFAIIVGPNGSGKTTLLRSLTGELSASGRVALDGQDIQRVPVAALAARRAVLPQSGGMAFPFRVIEVVRMGVEAGRHAADRTLAARSLEAVGLAGHAQRYFQELSGGEQQRTQLARVLAQVWDPVDDTGPRWLFLDEPVASLDIGHQLVIMEVARRYAERGGGVVAVMHDLNLTAMYADRVWLMSQGRILASGTVAEVLTDSGLTAAYGCRLAVNTPPAPGQTFVLPQTARI
ncbi:MAG: heme ABC transporter ATP-binding protein [Pseudomonadota bacterium]